MPIPSIDEQQQIAVKLDELLSQVDILKTRLDDIPKILKRFRQSVLAAAVSGKLTEGWRTKNKTDEIDSLVPKLQLPDIIKNLRRSLVRNLQIGNL